MNPSDIQVIGEELAVKWDDGTESFVRLAKLRKACPCAGCKGETDVMGQLHKGPERPYSLSSFRIRSLEYIGGYAGLGGRPRLRAVRLRFPPCRGQLTRRRIGTKGLWPSA